MFEFDFGRHNGGGKKWFKYKRGSVVCPIFGVFTFCYVLENMLSIVLFHNLFKPIQFDAHKKHEQKFIVIDDRFEGLGKRSSRKKQQHIIHRAVAQQPNN